MFHLYEVHGHRCMGDSAFSLVRRGGGEDGVPRYRSSGLLYVCRIDQVVVAHEVGLQTMWCTP